jgi:hypothetical protein
VVSIYIPEYVVGHWYEHILHNQSALRLKGRLLFTPGVMVTSVPYQLESSELAKRRAKRRADWSAPGSVRRGPVSQRPKESAGPSVPTRRSGSTDSPAAPTSRNGTGE